MFLIVVSAQTGTYMYSNKKMRFKSFSSSRGPRLGHRTGSSMMPKVQAPEMACRKSEAVELAKGVLRPLDTLPTAFPHIHPNFRSARSTSTSKKFRGRMALKRFTFDTINGGISEYPGGMCGCLSFDTHSQIHGTHPIYAY